jgi:UDP-glucuronate 4-epimerase
MSPIMQRDEAPDVPSTGQLSTLETLVTGCAGFIGSHLTDALLAAGHRVLGVDSLLENYAASIKTANLSEAINSRQFKFLETDLVDCDLRAVTRNVDVVFHLAAEPGVRTSWGPHFDSYVHNNVLATQRILEAARSSSRARIIYASSSSVYGQAESLPTPENTIPRPFSPYGVTKLAAEHLCQLYGENYGVDVVCLRYFSVFGPRQRPDMAFHRFCRAALEGTPLSILGDGSQSRDFTFVSDVVEATLAAAVVPSASGGTYNVGAGSRVSVNTAIETLESVIGRSVDVRFSRKDYGDVASTGADIAKAQKDLQYEPRTSFKDGLRAELKWIEENLELLARKST